VTRTLPQHETGSARIPRFAIEDCDRNLYEVWKALDDRKLAEKTGHHRYFRSRLFSTIKRNADVAAILKKHRFKAGRKFEDTEAGDVMVVGLGGSVALYVIIMTKDHSTAGWNSCRGRFCRRDFFRRIPIEGTFPLDQVKINTTNPAPDLIVSMRWMPDAK